MRKLKLVQMWTLVSLVDKSSVKSTGDIPETSIVYIIIDYRYKVFGIVNIDLMYIYKVYMHLCSWSRCEEVEKL